MEGVCVGVCARAILYRVVKEDLTVWKGDFGQKYIIVTFYIRLIHLKVPFS